MTGTRDVIDLFAEQVEAGPHTPAVDKTGTVKTYEQLRTQAFQLAAAIQSILGNPSPRILIAMAPSASAYPASVHPRLRRNCAPDREG
jgi:non-ribosomal peptide synthetase component F